MFRILLVLTLALLPINAFAITQWTVNVPTSSSDLKSNFPVEALANNTVLQTLLQNYRQGFILTYNNSTTITIGAGEVSAWNGSASLFLQNTSPVNATTANLDTGSSFSASTTYYVYAGTSSSTASTATISISLNNTTPSNLTYYKQLGYFTADSSGNIARIFDNSDSSHYGAPVTSYAVNTPYLAATDLNITAWGSVVGSSNYPSVVQNFIMTALAGPSSPSITMDYSNSWVQNSYNYGVTKVVMFVPKGYYWEVTTSGTQSGTIIAVPKGN